VTFSAFSPDMLAFLRELAANNDRDWFKANQKRYERDVREPVRAFVRAMTPVLDEHAPALTADDRKVGGSMMRPQRDTRFSADKTPYKVHVGVQFRHQGGKDVHAPGLYLHIHPDELFVGLGMYRPASADLKSIRERISAEPQAWTEIVEDERLKSVWSMGDRDNLLKSKPRGFDADDPMIDWLRMKSHILVRDLERDEVFSPGLPERMAGWLQSGSRHAGFLCEAIGQPW